jgi:hypothetical protein
MAQQHLDFRPLAQGGDNPTAAFTKIEGNFNELYPLATNALPKSGGTVTGNLAVGGAQAAAGSLDVMTANGRMLIRPSNGVPVIDAVNVDNSGFGEGGMAATVFHFISRSGDHRLLFRQTSGYPSIDAVNGANSAFRDLYFNATGYTFGGNMKVNGNITASGTVTPSDKRLKKNIQPCQVTRGMALSLAQAFAEWDLIYGGAHQSGVVAQVAQDICPRHVFEIDYTPPATVVEGTTDLVTYPSVKRLGVDNVGMAMEASMDNALDIADLKAALGAAVDRIAALEAR